MFYCIPILPVTIFIAFALPENVYDKKQTFIERIVSTTTLVNIS